MIATMRVSGATTNLSASTENQVVVSVPPYTHTNFKRIPASIMVCPLGYPGDHDYVVLLLDLEEAEALSDRLAHAVAQAKEGEYSAIGDTFISELRLDTDEPNGEG